MPNPCAYLRTNNGSALPPALTPNLPPGSAQAPSPQPLWRERIRFEDFDTAKLVVNTTGAALATAAAAAGQSSAFPQAFRAAQYSFTVPVGAILFSLAASITGVAAGVSGIFAFKSNAQAIAIATGPTPLSIIDMICQPNSLAGIPNPSVRNVQLALTDKTAMRFDNNAPLSIYLSAPNDANTLITASLTVYYITLNAGIHDQ